MMVARFADLDEKDAAPEMIDYLLKTMGVPPLDCKVALASGGDYPEWQVFAECFRNLRHPGFFDVRYPDVSFEICRRNWDLQAIREELVKTVNEMPRVGIAAMDQRIFALDR